MTTRIEIGSRLGDYEIVSELGRGGAGAVYVARHQESEEEVALKVLHTNHEMAEEVERRFVREIAVAQNINSPYVVKYFGCGLGEDGVLYYTMERVPWGSLKDVLKSRGKLPWRDAAECCIQIAKGLEAIHAQNVIHRDLKPENIFLADDGRLKLGDFGLVRAIDKSRLTLDGTTVGTAKYLAPEQARGEDVDARTDLYALGCNLFELIAGRPPFVASNSSLGYVELMKQHVEDVPPSVTDFAPSCPTELAALISKLLEKPRGHRMTSASATAARLQEILDSKELLSEGSHVAEDEESNDPAEPGSSAEEQSLTERLRSESDGTAPEVNIQALVVTGVILAAAIAAYVVIGKG